MSRISYVNGLYVSHAQASVHVEDRGFQFADGVYEVWAVLGARLADSDGHFARLERSLSELRIPSPMSRGALETVLRETVRRNRVRDGIVYLQVTRGRARRDHAFPAPETPPTVVATARSLDMASAEAQAGRGVAVVTTAETRWARCDIKTVGLLPNALAKQAAREQVFRLWPNMGLPGELSQELRSPAHFEQAVSVLGEDDVVGDLPVGPDPARYVESLKEYADAGVDRVYLQQIGSQQEPFLRFLRDEVLPQL